MKLNDIDLIELNEAFAAQSLAVVRELGIDRSKVNVNGGAIAVGHPLGSSGARLSVQLFNELRRQNKKYGMVTACVGGGQGVAGIYELLN
jgi:acetyl-CoA acyltransferase